MIELHQHIVEPFLHMIEPELHIVEPALHMVEPELHILLIVKLQPKLVMVESAKETLRRKISVVIL